MIAALLLTLGLAGSPAPAVQDPASTAEDDARATALARVPTELPRAAPGRWEGAFGDRQQEVLGSIARETLEGLSRAEAAYHAGDFPVALTRLYGVLEAEPDFPPALLVLGTAYFRLRRYGDAIVCIERFVEIAPSQVWRTQALAHCYYSLGRYGDARSHYERVLADLPDSVEAIRGLALAHAREGGVERALELLARVVELAPDHADAWAWTAQLQWDEGLLDEALASAERAKELAPYEPRPWFLLARIYDDLDREGDAARVRVRWKELDRVAQEVRALEGRLLFDPRDWGAASGVVEAWRSVANLDATRAALDRLVAIRPPSIEEADVCIYALDVLLSLDDAAGAQVAARTLAERCPTSGKGWRRLELYYATIGDTERQIEAGEKYRRFADIEDDRLGDG